MKKKKENKKIGQFLDCGYNPEKVEKSVAVQLAEQVENQYRVFAEEIKNIKQQQEKKYRELLSHIATLYLKLEKVENKTDIGMFSYINGKLEALKDRISKLEKETQFSKGYKGEK